MLKLCLIVLAAVVYHAQCLPVESHSQTATSSHQNLQLVIHNSSEATNYHLTPVLKELGNIDDEINAELENILPYINFLFDTLLGRSSDEDDNSCINDMVIQLVPENDNDEDNVTTDTQAEDTDSTSADTPADDADEESADASAVSPFVTEV